MNINVSCQDRVSYDRLISILIVSAHPQPPALPSRPGEIMKWTKLATRLWRNVVLAVMFTAAWQAKAQDAKTSYPAMAPLEQYLIADRDEKIKLARSAAPPSISADAE